MPSGARSYMGLGFRSRCTILVCLVMTNFFMQSCSIAPLPLRSYVGLGMDSIKFVVTNFGVHNWFSVIALLPTRTYAGLGVRNFGN